MVHKFPFMIILCVKYSSLARNLDTVVETCFDRDYSSKF